MLGVNHCHYFYLMLDIFSFTGYLYCYIVSYLALILLLCEMCFIFDVLLRAVQFAYPMLSPLSADWTVHFRFTILLQFFISTEDAIIKGETHLEVKDYACFYFGNFFFLGHYIWLDYLRMLVCLEKISQQSVCFD